MLVIVEMRAHVESSDEHLEAVNDHVHLGGHLLNWLRAHLEDNLAGQRLALFDVAGARVRVAR